MKINLLLVIFLRQLNLIVSIFVHIFMKLFKKNISIRGSWKFRRSSFVLQAMPEREYSKICLFYITPFPTLIFGSLENFDSVVSIDKWFFGNSFYERWLPSKLFLYNFSAANIYETFFHNVCVGKTACFNFCSHFYKKFVANSLYYQSVIYEHMEICCSCLECLNNFSLKTFFWAEKRLFYWFEKPFDTILLWLRQ